MTAQRRHRVVGGVLAAAGVSAATVGVLVAIGSGDDDERGGRPVPPFPSVSGEPRESAGGDHVAPMPAHMPECGDEPMTALWVDWPVNTSSSAREAAERVLGRPLPQASLEELTPQQYAVVVARSDGSVRALVTVVGGDRQWNPMTLYHCSSDDPARAE